MEGEKEYLETDVRKIVLEHLKELGMEADLVDSGKSNIEKQPFFSFYFSGTPRMVDSMGCINVQGKNFDYVHIIRRG